jgi:bifunctional DNA-binding transcriptional regulator/antitoxin component of YhaV-PrlF toxin-antitoxin module
MSDNSGRGITAQVDSEGCVTIPEEWLMDLGWQAGDEVAFRSDGSSIFITKVLPPAPSEQE